MNPNVAGWELGQQPYDARWSNQYPLAHRAPAPYAFPEQPAARLAEGFDQLSLKKLPKTRTSPVATRTKIVRQGSHKGPARPSSSGGEQNLPSYRPFASTGRSTSYSQPTALDDFRASRRWPPHGYRQNDALEAEEAEDFICAGTPTFLGCADPIPNAPKGYTRFYAVVDDEHQGRTDRASFQKDAYRALTLDLVGIPEKQSPQMSLEQPCLAYAFGKSAGTTTLNFWASKSSNSPPKIERTGTAVPRKMKLLQILDRLQSLEEGLEEDNPAETQRYLYSTLIEDPAHLNGRPFMSMQQQIQDLIDILMNPQWLDFSNPRNQVVAKWFDSPDQRKKQEFFHQLLLSVELYLRIHARQHNSNHKRKLIQELHPSVAWDLAVAQRWLDNMSITKKRESKQQSTFSFQLKSKSRQREALRHFAATLKWPNMDEVEYILDEEDMNEKALEDRSADAMSWFSGIILPGRTLPWLIMNSLIDCDRDTGDALKYLTHMQPASGFQYRANTYWSASCIVGKVLGAARGVKQIAGWIGPCIYTPDLKRTECVKVKQYESPDPRLTEADILSMEERSNPLGPIDESYPVDDYEVPMPDTEDVTDLIRIEKLAFLPAKEQPSSTRNLPGAPMLFDAAIHFACGGSSWPLRLKYDVSFINAFPCHQGPHVLFYDFAYKAVRIDDGLVDLHDWHTQSGRLKRPSPRSSPKKLALEKTVSAHEQVNRVLAIEALGVSDNEVFARAWCAHHGFSAIVANIKETCMACAIREAYAACVSVVILTEGGKERESDS